MRPVAPRAAEEALRKYCAAVGRALIKERCAWVIGSALLLAATAGVAVGGYSVPLARLRLCRPSPHTHHSIAHTQHTHTCTHTRVHTQSHTRSRRDMAVAKEEEGGEPDGTTEVVCVEAALWGLLELMFCGGPGGRSEGFLAEVCVRVCVCVRMHACVFASV